MGLTRGGCGVKLQIPILPFSKDLDLQQFVTSPSQEVNSIFILSFAPLSPLDHSHLFRSSISSLPPARAVGTVSLILASDDHSLSRSSLSSSTLSPLGLRRGQWVQYEGFSRDFPLSPAVAVPRWVSNHIHSPASSASRRFSYLWPRSVSSTHRWQRHPPLVVSTSRCPLLLVTSRRHLPPLPVVVCTSQNPVFSGIKTMEV